MKRGAIRSANDPLLAKLIVGAALRTDSLVKEDVGRLQDRLDVEAERDFFHFGRLLLELR